MRRAAGTPNPTAVKPAGDAPATPAPAPPSPETTARRLRLLDGLLVGVVLVFAFLAALFPVYNSDFFLHAATGRLLAHGEYHFGVDPFAFTTAGVYWVNHGWLYDLLVYLIYDSSAAGGAILIVLKALMVVALAEVMLRTARPPGRSLWIPAACVGLAVLVMSPRLLLQPTAFSYFFLGLTLWLLGLPRQLRARAVETNAPPPRRPFLPYWLIPPLCLLWVNLDSWFLLGPAAVALVLLGETLQGRLAPVREGPEAQAPGERRTIFLVLLISIAACLVNPHHIWAFALPPELGLSEAANAFNKDPQYLSLFLAPFDQRSFRPGLLSVASLAYHPLVLLGAASFAAALWAGRLRWSRLVVWTAFFALGAWHARSIPFFAVVAGPITALNFLDFAARRVGADSSNAAANTRGAVFGRILTLLAGVALILATWPGWLQAQPDLRRVGCTVEPNRGLKEMAEQIASWRHDGLIEPGGRWFNTSPDVLHYLAWYCPGERGFIDQRVSLYNGAAADYLTARKSLSPGGDAEADDASWRSIFHKHDAHYLIWSGTTSLPIPSASPLWRLFSAPNEWPLLYMNGYTAVFAWRDPSASKEAKEDPFTAMEYNSDRAAFAPDAVQAPALPAPEPRPHEWWEALWASEPPRPPEADEAAAQLVRFESLRPAWRARNEPVWNSHWADLRRGWQIDGAVGCLGPGAGYNAFRLEATARALTLLRDRPPPLPSFPPKQGEEQEYALARTQFDIGPPSALYLGVRAARRALALRPNDASTYEALAQAYQMLGQQTRDGDGGQVLGYPSLVRQVQIAAALRHALDLDPDREIARLLSFQLYEETGFLDLAAVHARERLRIRREEGEPEGELKTLTDQADQLDRDVEKRQTTYELRAAGKSEVDRASVAVQLGLGGKAMEVLEKVAWKDMDSNDPNKPRGVERELSLMLRTGRAAEVARTLADEEASLKGTLGVDPDSGLPAYEWLRVEAAAALGDYGEADRWLEALQKKMVRPAVLVQALGQFGVIRDDPGLAAEAKTPELAALLMGHLVLREAPSALGAVWLQPNTRNGLLSVAGGQVAGLLGLQSDLDAVRGWLALEAGRTADARERLSAARERASVGAVPFPGGPLTRTCLERLDAAK